MPLNNLGLGFMFRATDMASGIMDTIKQNFVGLSDVAGRSIDGLDGMVRKLGGGLTMTAAGAGGLAATFGLADRAGKFETSLKRLQRVTQQLPDEISRVGDTAKAMGTQLGRSPTELIEGLYDLSTMGYSAADSLKLLPDLIKFASGSDIDLARATGILNQALKGFGIETSLAVPAMDQMMQAANAMAMNVGDLSIAFGRLAPGVHSVGGTLTDALTVFGLAKNALGGIQISATATSLAFERLSNPKVLAAMQKLGVEVLDQDRNFKKIPGVLAAIQEKYVKLGGEADKSAFLEKMFGRDGKKGVEAFFAQLAAGIESPIDHVTRYGADAVNHMHTFIARATETTKTAYEIMMDRFQGTKDRMAATSESLLETIGRPFISVWRPILSAITDAMNSIDSVLKSVDPKILEFGAAVLVAASAFFTFVGISKLVNAAWPLLSTGISLFASVFRNLGVELRGGWALMRIVFGPGGLRAAAGAFFAVGRAALASAVALWPWYLAAAAIGAVVYAVTNNIGGMGDAWDKVTEAFTDSGGGVMSYLGQLGDYFGVVWDIIKGGFVEAMSYFTPAFAWAADAIGGVMDMVGALARTMGVITEEGGPGRLMIFIGKLIGRTFAAAGTLLAVFVGLLAYLFKASLMVYNVTAKFLVPIFSFLSDIIESIGKSIAALLEPFGFFKSMFTHTPGIQVTPAAAVASPVVASLDPTKATAASSAGRSGLSRPAATLAHMGVQEGWATPATGGGTPRVDIDYEKMAAANRATPIVLNLDGMRVGSIIRNAEQSDAVRRGRPDQGDSR